MNFSYAVLKDEIISKLRGGGKDGCIFCLQLEEVEEIAEILKHDASITTLDLEDGESDEFGDLGARALADALKINTSLTELNLTANGIGGVGARALADALKTNTSLTKLNLTGNKIGDVGAGALADVLRTNSTLIELNLSDNKISFYGASLIGEALDHNTSLTKLSLDGNYISCWMNEDNAPDARDDRGIKALGIALQRNTSLLELFIDRNGITNDCIRDFIYPMVSTNFVLRSLVIDEGELEDVSEGDGEPLPSKEEQILHSFSKRNILIAEVLQLVKRRVEQTLGLTLLTGTISPNSPLNTCCHQILYFITSIVQKGLTVYDDLGAFPHRRIIDIIMEGTLEELQRLLKLGPVDQTFDESIRRINEIRTLDMEIHELMGHRKQLTLLSIPTELTAGEQIPTRETQAEIPNKKRTISISSYFKR
ncbi:MAG: hypothetical protein A2007_06040 [Verrucomicrobia bacterium GWC2_42_7]|nr:MAG: hypothetical protein A2007_06040 [Verrucomicrobia bacterium GWC2_42_7]